MAQLKTWSSFNNLIDAVQTRNKIDSKTSFRGSEEIVRMRQLYKNASAFEVCIEQMFVAFLNGIKTALACSKKYSKTGGL